MASADHYLDRYHARRKWARIHGIIAGLSIATIIGIFWAWLFVIRAIQHRRRAKSHKRQARDKGAEI